MKKKLSKKERYDLAKENLDKIITPQVLRESEEFHKKLSYISWEELNRSFTI